MENGLTKFINRCSYWIGDHVLGFKVYFPKGTSEADIDYQSLREQDRKLVVENRWPDVFNPSRVLHTTVETLEGISNRVKNGVEKAEKLEGHSGDSFGFRGATEPLQVHETSRRHGS